MVSHFGQSQALIQNFVISDNEGYNEYDMEEIFKAKPDEGSEEIELSMRGQALSKI